MKKKNNPFLPVNLSILEDGLQIKRGTLLFADISGFTRMSEHLASFGLKEWNWLNLSRINTLKNSGNT